MSPLKRYILLFIFGIMVFSEALDWNIPILSKTVSKDKLLQIDKVQELNSFIFRTTKTKNSKQNEVRSINFKTYTYGFTNTIFHYHKVAEIRPLFIISKVKSYLHLLQLY